jgi:hypothetical protein
VAPEDAADLSPGQETLVRFASLNDRSLPELRGQLSRLSADNLVDERTGESYLTAEVTVPLDRRGDDFQLRLGMPVELLIPLGRRTAFALGRAGRGRPSHALASSELTGLLRPSRPAETGASLGHLGCRNR